MKLWALVIGFVAAGPCCDRLLADTISAVLADGHTDLDRFFTEPVIDSPGCVSAYHNNDLDAVSQAASMRIQAAVVNAGSPRAARQVYKFLRLKVTDHSSFGQEETESDCLDSTGALSAKEDGNFYRPLLRWLSDLGTRASLQAVHYQ